MEKMMACVLSEACKVEYKEVKKPKINENEILVRVVYAGICGSDLPRSMSQNGARKYPIILGHEFCGIVEKIGEQCDGVNIGDHVVVAPLIPDPNSLYTKEGLFGLSDNYCIIGTGADGGFAEYVSVPKEHVIKLPQSIDFLDAVGIEPITISFHALQNASIKVGSTIAILGCGSIGQSAVQCAKFFGAKKIIAIDIDAKKLELAKNLGADVIINSKTEDLYQRIIDETECGVDVVIETAGNNITQEQALIITRKKAQIVFVGISHAGLVLSEEASQRILRSELTIKGSWNSYSSPYPGSAWTSVINFMEKGLITFKPIVSDVITPNELNDFLYKMYNKQIFPNKVIVKMSQD